MKVKINQLCCDGCGSCVAVCPSQALILNEKELQFLEERCIGCQKCVQACPLHAIEEDTE